MCPPGLGSGNGGKKDCKTCGDKGGNLSGGNKGGNLGGNQGGNKGGNLGGGSKGGDKGKDLGSGEEDCGCEFPDPDGYAENLHIVDRGIIEKQVRDELTAKYNAGQLVSDKGTVDKPALETMIKDEITKRIKAQGKQTGIAM